MLAMLGMKYNSEEALKFADYLFEFICYRAYHESVELAKERGAFAAFDAEKFIKSGFIQKHLNREDQFDRISNAPCDMIADWSKLVEDIRKHGIRNARLNSYAPTGTMSIVWGNNCSSGIEPIFDIEYDRKVKFGGQDDKDIKIVHMQDYAYGKWCELKKAGTEDLIDRSVFVTALDMTVKEHVDMLAIVAKHCDMSVSKTINIPEDYSFEDTQAVYTDVWKRGIKGCTIFRPNALRPGILITKDKKEETPKAPTAAATDLVPCTGYNIIAPAPFERGYVEDVPEGLTYRHYHLRTGCGSIHLFIGIDEYEGKIYDIYTNIGSGGCPINTQANSRLLSAAIRGGVPIEYLIEQMLKSGACPSYQYAKGRGEKLSKGKSCSSAIALVLKDLVEELKSNKDEEVATEEQEELNTAAITIPSVSINTFDTISVPVKAVEMRSVAARICPDCGAALPLPEGGCVTCKNCGWSKCGE